MYWRIWEGIGYCSLMMLPLHVDPFINIYPFPPLISHHPKLPVSYLSGVLAFQAEEDCLAFLVAVEAVLAAGTPAAVDCKPTQAKLGPASSAT